MCNTFVEANSGNRRKKKRLGGLEWPIWIENMKLKNVILSEDQLCLVYNFAKVVRADKASVAFS